MGKTTLSRDIVVLGKGYKGKSTNFFNQNVTLPSVIIHNVILYTDLLNVTNFTPP